MKKHLIVVSSRFLKTHPRAGEPTNFPESIKNGTKIHTLRGNYNYWKKKIDEVNEGKAVLIIKTWTGRPYKDPQEEVKVLGKGECGIQKCQVLSDSEFVFIEEKEGELKRHEIENNDGLSYKDFWNWFDKDVHDGGIIHFTNKKY